MPIDVVKVRLQYAGADGQKMYSGVMDAAKKTVKVRMRLDEQADNSPSFQSFFFDWGR